MKKALITGIFGQDGSYLTEILMDHGYEVHGIARTPLSVHAVSSRAHLHSKGITPKIHNCDLQDMESVMALVKSCQPEECYHLAARHYSAEINAEVGQKVDSAVYADNVLSSLNLLTAFVKASPHSRIVIAGSCAMYAAATMSPQRESMSFASNSLYGLSKIAGAQLADYYRKECGLRVSVAILYNHESPRRKKDFVTKKITHGLNCILHGKSDRLEIHNLYSIKDWGYAKDYANGMRLMCAQDEPRDFILATGKGHSVGDFLINAATAYGISDWQKHVYVRNTKLPVSLPMPLIGDPSEAYKVLGWKHSVSFRELIELMVDSERSGSLD